MASSSTTKCFSRKFTDEEEANIYIYLSNCSQIQLNIHWMSKHYNSNSEILIYKPTQLQLLDKIHKMKGKYTDVDEAKFKKQHEIRLCRLAKIIWPNDIEKSDDDCVLRQGSKMELAPLAKDEVKIHLGRKGEKELKKINKNKLEKHESQLMNTKLRNMQLDSDDLASYDAMFNGLMKDVRKHY